MARKFGKFCLKGHNTLVTGRRKDGHCTKCARANDKKHYEAHPKPKKRICKWGHDTFKCGRARNGGCKKCVHLAQKKCLGDIRSGKRKRVSRKRICINGHDTFIVGRNMEGSCNQCNRDASKASRLRHSKRFKEYSDKYRKEHKEELRIYNLNYSRKHKKESRVRKLKDIFDITLDDYNKLLKKQKDKCAGCKKHKSEFKKNLSVDHNHKTGKIRGLLCNGCNLALGYVNDDIKTLKRLIKYLLKS